MTHKILALAALLAAAPSMAFGQTCARSGGAGNCQGNQGPRPLGGGVPSYGGSPYGGPAYGSPYGGSPSYGSPANGSTYGSPGYGAPTYGSPGYGAQPLVRCSSCGQQYRGSHVCSSKPPSRPLLTSASKATAATRTASAAKSEPAISGLDEMFAESSQEDGLFNVEVRNPVGTNYRVVKADLTMKQATALGDRLGEAFWVVTRTEGASPKAKMAGNRATAQKMARTVSDSSLVRPSIASIAYRIVPVDAPAEQDLSGLEVAFDEPEPESASDVPPGGPPEGELLAASRAPAQEWVGVSVGPDGQPKKFTLRLDADGQAEISVPTSGGQSETIRSQYSLDNDELVLTGTEGRKTVVGKIVNKDDKRMTLVRSTGQITMFRQ